MLLQCKLRHLQAIQSSHKNPWDAIPHVMISVDEHKSWRAETACLPSCASLYCRCSRGTHHHLDLPFGKLRVMKTYLFLFFIMSFISGSAASLEGENKDVTRDVKVSCVDSGLCISCSKNEMVSLI